MSQTTQKRVFELISDEVAPAAAPAQAAPTVAAAPNTDQTAAARQLLFTALRALSQRAVTAVTNLFSLFMVSLVFIQFGRILDDPTPYKLEAVAGFAVFCLLIDIVRRRSV